MRTINEIRKDIEEYEDQLEQQSGVVCALATVESCMCDNCGWWLTLNAKLMSLDSEMGKVLRGLKND